MFNEIFEEFKFHDEAFISTLQINALCEGWFVILVNVGNAMDRITSDHTESYKKCTPFNTHIDPIKDSNQQNFPDTRRSLFALVSIFCSEDNF